MSKQAADLIAKILTTNPDKRISIAEIKKHPWFEKVQSTLSTEPGTFVGIHPAPIDPKILEEIESGFNISTDYAIKCIEANKHNYVTATYYLLLKKHIRNGGASIADARMTNYDRSVFKRYVGQRKPEARLPS